MVKTVAILTAGGLAPCLASAIGGLIERYSEVDPGIKIILYKSGYKGLLTGDSIIVTPAMREAAPLLHTIGGSPIGNSRVKLSNVADCVKRGFVKEGQDPRQVAADQLIKDGVDVLHTIGGDDTNTAAADLAAYLKAHNYKLQVIGLPKTIDNDIVPVKQSLGAQTAAEHTALFFQNVVAEQTANPRVLLIHEIMGRSCGYLTAAASLKYREWLDTRKWMPEIGHSRARYDIHAVYVPEMNIDIKAEAARLSRLMDLVGSVNVFLSEGAGIHDIVADMQARGEQVPRDPFGHVKLDLINPGQWFAKQFGPMVGADKVLVQKSGYYSRAAPANVDDLRLIKGVVDYAVEAALRGESGLVGHDEERGGLLRAIEFERIKGGKAFNIENPWFVKLLAQLGQPKGSKAQVVHGDD
jgi:pyrophosphate--fructose-6-phosphate 1-phosphotransferase